MGLILSARCASCGYARSGLRLGATMAEMSGERRSARHLYRCVTCREVAEVELALGEPPGSPACHCGAVLTLTRELAYPIVRLSGNRLAGHACPRCGAPELHFDEEGRFL